MSRFPRPPGRQPIANPDSPLKARRSRYWDAWARAKNQNYGCIPKDTSANEAGDQLLTWMKAASDPKYGTMALEDVAWEGVDTLWPCKAP